MTVTVGLDVATNTGYCLHADNRILVGRITAKKAHYQYNVFASILTDFNTYGAGIDVVMEDFVAYNVKNPVTTAKLVKLIGGFQTLLEIEEEQNNDFNLTLAHVKTVRKYFRECDGPELKKHDVRDICRDYTGLTLSDDETDAIAMCLWAIDRPFSYLSKVEFIRNSQLKV